jgi:hypothetical protein
MMCSKMCWPRPVTPPKCELMLTHSARAAAAPCWAPAVPQQICRTERALQPRLL